MIIMKKFIMCAVLAMLLPVMAKAQFGIEGGYGHSGLTEKVSSVSQTVGFDGVYLLADYTFSILNHFSISPGLQYEFLTENMKELVDAECRWNEHYIDIPVRFNYSFDVSKKVSLGAYAAPTLSFGIASKLNTRTLTKTSINCYEFFQDNSEANYGRFDFMLGLGILCNVENIRFRLGYDYGLVNRVSGVDDETLHRGRFQIGIGYMF